MIGKTLRHFRIDAKLGSGGMGEVYRAHDRRLERDVALKVLPAETLTDEVARKRFRKEALALSKLNHPNIATIYDFDTQDGVDFLVMEYVEGTTLSEKLSNGPLPEEEVTKLGRQVADALEEAHEHGVIHRDLKPGNVMVTSKGQAKVLDFGLAKLVRPVSETAVTESLTETPAAAGTLPYMAPEQLQGQEVDARTDIYALGAVLYQMATGRRPFPEAQAPQLIAAIMNESPQLPSGLNSRISAGLESIILKALEKDPEQRYQSSRELNTDLERLGGPEPLLAARRRRATRRQLLATAAVAVVALLVVTLGLNLGGLRDRLLGTAAPARIESIAVLPLENLSGDPEQDYFADGMTEALITDLGKISALRVISRRSVMRYRGSDKSLPEIARELNVDAVLDGSTLRSGDQVRITAQLIHVATDSQLWAERYERDLRDILTLQGEIATAIAREIEVKLTPQEQTRLARARPVNPEAYEAYLKGRFFSMKPTLQEQQKGLQYLQQAIEIDPNYALAYAGLADSYSYLVNRRFLPPREAYPKARTAATKALEIDDSLAEAHDSLAWISGYDWDWPMAEREYKRAIELNPNYVRARIRYGIFLGWMGRHEEAIREMESARKLDPLSVGINISLGHRYIGARQWDQAIDQCGKTLELENNPHAHHCLAWAYEGKKMYEQAIGEFKEALSLVGGSDPHFEADIAAVYALMGRREEALNILEQLKPLRSKQGYAAPYGIAYVYAALGQRDEAFEWLEKAYVERHSNLPDIKTHMVWDPLRSDPRIQDLLRRMNFPE